MKPIVTTTKFKNIDVIDEENIIPSKKILVTGASGTIGTITLAALGREYQVIAIDKLVSRVPIPNVTWVRGSINDMEFMNEAVKGCHAVINLATGVREGLRGLTDVDTVGVEMVLEAAREAGVRRVIIASSGKVTEGYELDAWSKGNPIPENIISVNDTPMPESPYSMAKLNEEQLSRKFAKDNNFGVSCIRFGIVRVTDKPEVAVDDPDFRPIPGEKAGRLRRVKAAWLYHSDLIKALQEELISEDQYRLRYAVSDNLERFWSLDILKVNS